jgi:hypothetical protein
MEPISAISLVASCGAIANKAVRMVYDLHQLIEKYSSVQMTVGVLVTHIHTIQSASERLKAWLETRQSRISEEDQRNIKESITTCDQIMGHIHDHIITYDKSASPGVKSNVQWLWNERTIREFRDLLNCQIQALSFHIQMISL